MNIETPPIGALNYQSCRYGQSKLLFRGPQRSLGAKYGVCIGGTETFGKFIPAPYPDLLEVETGLPMVNLGCQRAGIDTYMSSQSLLDICSGAQITIIQIMGAANMSNRFYTVDPRNNERFLRAARRLKEIYPEIDFTKFELTNQMLTELAEVGADRLHLVRHELQCAWVARMRSFLSQVSGPKVLLWLAGHAPFSNNQGGTICREPLFVDRAMLNAVKNDADALVEVVANPVEVTAGRNEMVIDPMESATSSEILGPVVHRRVIEALQPTIMRLLQANDAPAQAASEVQTDAEPMDFRKPLVLS